VHETEKGGILGERNIGGQHHDGSAIRGLPLVVAAWANPHVPQSESDGKITKREKYKYK
jgi:hypothetical protein